MRLQKAIIIGLFVFATIGLAICFAQSYNVHAERSHQDVQELYQYIRVVMYPLREDGSRDTDQQQDPLCRPDDPSTPQNEADDRYGCTAFPGEGTEYPYPYTTNPVTVSIEGDYLLDVVPREMEPSYHPLALRAQAITARTYAYCAIRANQGEEDSWGNCRKEINNSNQFQVFVPYSFDRLSTADQQAIREAVNETGGRYLIYAPESGKGPIFAEFSADAYLRTMPGDYGYLHSVEDPISYDPAIPGIISGTHAHQRGLSQNGASRWGWGNSSRYGTETLWSIRWEDYRQILVHYYTGVHIVDSQGNTLTPDDRWNLLNHTVPSTVTAASIFTSSLMLQNTSTWDWWEEALVLGYQWTAPGVSPLPDEWREALGLPFLQTGESITVEVPVESPTQAGSYSLHIDLGRGVVPSSAKGLPEATSWFHDGGWPHAVIPVAVEGGLPTPTLIPTPIPTPIPTLPIPTPIPPPIPTPTPQPTPTPMWRWKAVERAALQERPPQEQEAYSRLLSRVRDEVMAPDPKGEAYIWLVYQHAPEMMAMLLEDPSLRQEVAALMDEAKPLLEEMLEGKEGRTRLTASWVRRAQAVLEKVEAKASPELRAEIRWWRRWLPRFEGKTGWEIWQMLPEREIKPGAGAIPVEAVLRGLPAEEMRGYWELLSRIWDEVILRSPGGEAYVALVYKYTPEVVGILAGDEQLRQEAEALLVEARPGLESWVSGKGEWRFSREWVRRTETLLRAIAEKGSPSLRAELLRWRGRVLKWEGQTPQEVWQGLLREERARGRK